MSKLEGKIALVTGASRGLGRAIAIAYADAGADVAVASRSIEGLEAAAAEIRSRGRRAFPVAVDVADSQSVARMAQATQGEFGRIDVLVNSAGVAMPRRLIEMSDQVWARTLQTNLTGTFYCCRQVAQIMVEQKSGAIINLASVAGVKGPTTLGAYAASKAGVIMLTRVLALELARYNIRVNALAPGYFRTDMNAADLDNPEIGPKIVKRIPMQRPGEPEEIGPLAVFLASEDASFATGEVYFLSGGEMAR